MAEEPFPPDAIPFAIPAGALRLTSWPVAQPLDRIHAAVFGAAQFNPGVGQARFSPLFNVDGTAVPTLYAGESVAVALMETLLRDLPLRCAGYPVDCTRLEPLMHSRLLPHTPLALIDLNPRLLKRLGTTPAELLHCGASAYPLTQRWAGQLYHACPQAQGICWASRQHGGLAVMLFGDRLPAGALEPAALSCPASRSAELIMALEALADEMALVLC
ncbi:MAG: hypothetical protein K0S95_332 [Pantoea eucrina]|jgi:hypothetical protein|uniref:RES family NAD+ phosphorylase n=2 Tax=Pseudomonadota TaxID=1224 RepID=UPI00080F3EC6|nr:MULTISPECIES: RES family NAD+ phosphorylase [Pantoea]MDF2783797.1 hypothetical protein [Pantoea eucrina]